MANTIINRLILAPGTTQTFDATNTYTITNYVNGDWNGTAGNYTKFRSNPAGSRNTIIIPGDITTAVQFMDFRDTSFSGGRVTAGSNCIGQTGNNLGIIWPNVNTWIAADDGTWSTDSSWSLGHAPTATENVVFDNTSIKYCFVDVDATVNSITIASTYNNNFSFANRTVKVNTGFYAGNPGTFNYGNGITFSGDSATFYLDSSVSTVTASSCNMRFDGTLENSIVFNKALAVNFKNLTLGPDATLMVVGSSGGGFNFWSSTSPLKMESRGLFDCYIRTNFAMSASGYLFDLTGNPIIGLRSPNISSRWDTNADNITITIPPISILGNSANTSMIFLASQTRNNSTFQLGGDFTYTGIFSENPQFDKTENFNTQNFGFNVGTWNFGIDTKPAANLNINTGSSTITVGNINTTDYTNGTTVWNLGTSNLICSGNLKTQAQHQITFGNSIRMTGNNSTFTILKRAGVGTLTSPTNCTLYIDASNVRLIDHIGVVSFKTLVIGDNASFVSDGTGSGTAFSGSNPLITIGDNGHLAQGPATLVLYPNGSGNVWSLGSDYTWSGNGQINWWGLQSGYFTVPATTRSGVLSIACQGSSVDSTVTFAGLFKMVGGTLLLRSDSSANALFNMENDFTCGTLNVGATTGGDFTFNAGSGNYSISSYNNSTYNTGFQSINLQSSKWFLQTNWLNGSVCNFDPGTSTVTAVSGCSVTSAGKPFYNFVAQAVAANVSTLDTLNIADGGRLLVNTPLILTPSASIAPLNFLGSYTYDGTGNTTVGGSTASITITIPPLTYTGSGTFIVNPAATATTVFSGPTELMGNLTLSTGAVTFSSPLILDGTRSLFRANPGVGTVTASACDMTFMGSDTTLSDAKGMIFRSLYLGPNAVLDNTGAATTLIQSANTPLKLDTSAMLKIDGTGELRIVLTASAPFYSLGDGASLRGLGSANGSNLRFQIITNSLTGSLPALNMDGTRVNVSFYDGNGRRDCTYQATGNLNFGQNNLITSIFGSTASSMVFDTSGFDVTCGEFRPGSNTVTGNTAIIKLWSSNLSCLNHTIVSDNSTSILNYGTSSIYCSGNFTTGTKHQTIFGTNLRMTGNNSVLTLSATVGSAFLNAANCNLRIDGSGVNLVDNKAVTFKTLTLGPLGVSTNTGGSQNTTFISTTTPLTIMGSDSTLNVANSYAFYTYGSVPCYSITGTPLITSSVGSRALFFRNSGSGNDVTATLPAIRTSGILGLYILAEGGVRYTYNQTGDIFCNASFRMYAPQAGTVGTFNTNGYGISAASIDFYSSATGSTSIFNFGDSDFSTSGAIGANSSALGDLYYNMSTSRWRLGGSLTIPSDATVDPGLSLITFLGSASTLTSNGKTLYDITLEGASSVTLVGAVSCHNLTINEGTWSNATVGATFSGSLLGNSTGSYNFGSGLTFNGNATQFYLSGSAGSVTASSCVVTFNGLDQTANIQKSSTTWSRLAIGNGASLNYSCIGSTSRPSWYNAGSCLSIGNDATFHCNSDLLCVTIASGNDAYTTGSNYLWDGTGTVFISAEQANTIKNLPAVVYRGSGILSLIDIGAQSLGSPVTYKLTGNMDWSSTVLVSGYGSDIDHTTNFNTETYSLKCNNLNIGNRFPLTTFNANFGSSTDHTIGNLNVAYNQGKFNLNWGSGSVAVDKDWTYGSTWTVGDGTSTVILTPANQHILTSAGKNLPKFKAQRDTIWH